MIVQKGANKRAVVEDNILALCWSRGWCATATPCSCEAAVPWGKIWSSYMWIEPLLLP